MNRKQVLATAFILLASAPAALRASQSLADAARKEAERRKSLQSQGIEGKVIKGDDPSHLAPEGNISTSSLPALSPSRAPKRAEAAASRRSLISYQIELQKIDRQIRQTEERLNLVRARAQAERWTPLRSGKAVRSTNGGSSLERLRQQILEQETKLKRLRQERLETYSAARRAWYLPGEIDGKGVVP
jgi:hypothetical protein